MCSSSLLRPRRSEPSDPSVHLSTTASHQPLTCCVCLSIAISLMILWEKKKKELFGKSCQHSPVFWSFVLRPQQDLFSVGAILRCETAELWLCLQANAGVIFIFILPRFFFFVMQRRGTHLFFILMGHKTLQSGQEFCLFALPFSLCNTTLQKSRKEECPSSITVKPQHYSLFLCRWWAHLRLYCCLLLYCQKMETLIYSEQIFTFKKALSNVSWHGIIQWLYIVNTAMV